MKNCRARFLYAALALAILADASAAMADEARVDVLLRSMTPEEKLTLVRGLGAYDGPEIGWKKPEAALGGAGFVPGIPRLGIPDVNQTDAGQGVNSQDDQPWARTATSLPSALAAAASWDIRIARTNGEMIATEARHYGFNMILAGAMDLTREPRNGRNFEYWGEDPLLAGTLAGHMIAGIQSQHVMSTMKHFALNAQETGRTILSADIAEAALRESDLLAFEFANEIGHPAAVMTSYNRLNGVYTSESPFLLGILKRDWKYPGYVLSDWGGQHSTVAAANAGSDQESASPPSGDERYYGKPLAEALLAGSVSRARLDDMVRRILRSMDAVGILRPTPPPQPLDYATDEGISLAAAEAGAVLLKNDGDILPLAKATQRIAVIGGRADVGVLSGGGSGQVVGRGGVAVRIRHKGQPDEIYHASSPLDALRAVAPKTDFVFASGEDLEEAKRAAQAAELVILFADQWTSENLDVPSLDLPRGQDALIIAISAVNPHIVVVLETGGPVKMPWVAKVPAIVEAWYPGTSGGPAIARLLFGDASPQGRLPITFPESEAQLPRPKLDGLDQAAWTPYSHDHNPAEAQRTFSVDYNIEGARIGYKWFAHRGMRSLFAFGHGLTYTRFAYSNLNVGSGGTVAFDVTNVGSRSGTDTPQVYLGGPDNVRLVGWSKETLAPGQTAHVALTIDPRLLARWDSAHHDWRIEGGKLPLRVGASSSGLPLTGTLYAAARRISP